MHKIVRYMALLMILFFVLSDVVDASYNYNGIDVHPTVTLTDTFVAQNTDNYIYQINFYNDTDNTDDTEAALIAAPRGDLYFAQFSTRISIRYEDQGTQVYTGVINRLRGDKIENDLINTAAINDFPDRSVQLIDWFIAFNPVMPPPDAPTGLQADNGNGQVILSWQSVPDADSYNIYRDGVLIDSTTSTSYTDTNVINGQTYTYTITAVNNDGESLPSSPVTGQPFEPMPQDTPTGLQINNGNGQVILSWQSVPDAASYKVYRDGDLLINTTSTSYTDTNVINGQTYTYTITAVNNDGESPPSAPITGEPFANVPASPSVTVTNGNQEVALQWQPVPNATSYNVYRDGILIDSTTSTSFTQTDLTNGQTYTYTITAVNADGESLPATVTGRPSDLPSFGGINLGVGIGDMLRTATGFLGLYNVWVLLVAGVLFVPVLVWFIFWVIGKTRRSHVTRDRGDREGSKQSTSIDRSLGRRSMQISAKESRSKDNIKPLTNKSSNDRADRQARAGRSTERVAAARSDRVGRIGRSSSREGRAGRL